MTTIDKPNRYPGPCAACGQSVAAFAGVLARVDGKLRASHRAGQCPSDADRAPAPVAIAPTFAPTVEQANAVTLFLTGEDLVIEAGAGASKTTTLMMCAAAAPDRTGVVTAFNKKIITEVADVAPGNVTAQTVHSMAYRAVMAPQRAWTARIINGSRMRSMDIARILRLDNFSWSYGSEHHTIGRDRLAGMAMRAVQRFCQSGDLAPSEQHIAYVDGIDLPRADGERTYANNDALRRHLMPAVRRCWEDLSNPTGGHITGRRLDHVYLKVWALGDPAILADFLMVDEAQDLSGVMIQILEKQTCQIVLVGDRAQAIYGYLGLRDGIQLWIDKGAQVGRLSKSFRFGDAVADVANGLLERAGHDLRLTGFERVLSTIGPHPEPTAVLCRTNATAVRTCLTALGDGKRPHLVGGAAEIVAFAEAARDLQAQRGTSHPDLAIFDNWAQVQQYVGQDDGEDLQLLVKLIDEFGPQAIIDGLGRTARERPAGVPPRDGDGYADLVVSTVHKAKGCGWDVVQIAGDFTAPDKGGDMSVDELRLAYVAVTRAKRHLDVEAVPHFLAPPEPELPETAIGAEPTTSQAAGR